VVAVAAMPVNNDSVIWGVERTLSEDKVD